MKYTTLALAYRLVIRSVKKAYFYTVRLRKNVYERMEIITLFKEYSLHAPYIELFNMDQYLY